jgi:hypothetical protein
VPRMALVGTLGAQQAVPIWAPTVEFLDNRYRTTDPEIARGMIENEANFGREAWGWTLELDCVPQELRSLWAGLGIENKRIIGLGLVEGKTADAIFDELDEDDVKAAELASSKQATMSEYAVSCPAAGCGMVATGAGAQVTLENHLRLMHPTFEGA